MYATVAADRLPQDLMATFPELHLFGLEGLLACRSSVNQSHEDKPSAARADVSRTSRES